MAHRQHIRTEPPSAPRPPPILDVPWRNLNWGFSEFGVRKNQDDLKYVRGYTPAKENIQHLRILLYGPVGAGKSSFINSVSNVLRGRMTMPALASATTSDRSFTRKYTTHKFWEGRGNEKTFFPLVFNDIMGLEEGTNQGVHADDIKLAMKGHVVEGHKFNPVNPLSYEEPGYNRSPSADDRVHVLVCVLSANSPQITPSILQKMSNIRETASDLGIPQMAMMTHIDAACAEIEKDLRNVYRSKHLKKKMKDFSAAVGIPMNCIFPVKNYSEENQLNPDVDTLILDALKMMINFGDDFIEQM